MARDAFLDQAEDWASGSGAACLTPSPVQVAGEGGGVEKWGQPKSSLLCVSVETTKATKRRSYPFCVSVSWEQQVEAALWFYIFTTGSYK